MSERCGHTTWSGSLVCGMRAGHAGQHALIKAVLPGRCGPHVLAWRWTDDGTLRAQCRTGKR